MRDYANTMEVFNALTCVLVGSDATGCTGYGATVDAHGFADVMAVACLGALHGSSGSPVELVVSLQEAVQGTGPFYTIGDGAVNGSCIFKIRAIGQLSTSGGTHEYMGRLYERINTPTRKRYLRVHAAMKGTSATRAGGPLSVALLLGRPQSTLYIQKPSSVGTGNGDHFIGNSGGSYFLVA